MMIKIRMIHNLVQDIFEYKIPVIVGRSQLDILENELIYNGLCRQYRLLQIVPMLGVLQ